MGCLKLSYYTPTLRALEKNSFSHLRVVEKKGTRVKKCLNYYPFGMLMPGRHASSENYRYGFQNQEVDNEIKGIGNSVNYKYRMHDPRLGRFFAVDPLTADYPHYTPYSFSGNKVIAFIELEGLEEVPAFGGTGGTGENNDAIPTRPTEELSNQRFLEQPSTPPTYAEQIQYKQEQIDNLYDQIKIKQESNQGLGLLEYQLSGRQNELLALQNKVSLLNRDQGGTIGPTKPPAAAQFSYNIVQGVAYGLSVTPLGWESLALSKIGSIVTSFKGLSRAAEFGIDTYKVLKGKLTTGSGLQVHHLLEQRFAATLNVDAKLMKSIVLTPKEHQAFTNAWRKLIPYDGGPSLFSTSTATQAQINNAAKTIYKDYPEVLKALGL